MNTYLEKIIIKILDTNSFLYYFCFTIKQKQFTTMKMSRGFVKAVFSEVKNIREMATDVQKSRLNAEKLSGQSGSNCVYAQLSGGYFDSPLAEELKSKFRTGLVECGPAFSQREFNLIHKQEQHKYAAVMPPLEMFVFHRTEYVAKNFIPYIKGETDKLPSMASFVKNN